MIINVQIIYIYTTRERENHSDDLRHCRDQRFWPVMSGAHLQLIEARTSQLTVGP